MMHMMMIMMKIMMMMMVRMILSKATAGVGHIVENFAQ